MKIKNLIVILFLSPILLGTMTSTTSASDDICDDILEQCLEDNPYPWIPPFSWLALSYEQGCYSSHGICTELMEDNGDGGGN